MPTNPKTPASSRPQGATLAPNKTIPPVIPSRSPTLILDPGDPVAVLNIRGINEDNKTDISALAMALEMFGDFRHGTSWDVGKDGAAQQIAITRLLRKASLLYGNNRLATNNDLQKAVSDIKEAITTSHGHSQPTNWDGGSYAAAVKRGLGAPTNQAAIQKQKMMAELQQTDLRLNEECLERRSHP
jgi:hypothetical protein